MEMKWIGMTISQLEISFLSQDLVRFALVIVVVSGVCCVLWENCKNGEIDGNDLEDLPFNGRKNGLGFTSPFSKNKLGLSTFFETFLLSCVRLLNFKGSEEVVWDEALR